MAKSQAESYTINVSSPQNQGKQLSVFVYQEYFTESLDFITSIYLDDLGQAQVQVDAPKNELIVFRIGSVNTQFYAGESSEYFIIFNTDKALKPLKFNNNNWAPISFSKIDSLDINVQMEELNSFHNQFFNEHYSDLLQVLSQPNSHVKKGLTDNKKVRLTMSENDSTVVKNMNLQELLENEYTERLKELGYDIEKEDFLNITARYLKMELSSLLGRNQDFIFNQYLNEKKYLRNVEYMNAAKTYYSGVLEGLYTSKSRNLFNKYIYNLDLDSALTLADSIIPNHNKELEFELLAGIEKALDLPNISNRDVTMLLEVIIRKGSPTYSQMAKNLRSQFQVGKQGYQIPECQFLDLSEELKTSEEWTNKIVYLNFFTTWNSESIGYLEQIKALERRYGIQVEFISVCMDESWTDYKDFLINHPKYDWQIFFGNTDKLLKEKLGIQSIPYHLLIGADGKIVMDFTPDPYSVEPALKRLLN